MGYRVSKYNFHVRNDSGEILLYNSLKGEKSFIKFSAIDAGMVEAVLTDGSVVDADKSILQILLAYGFLVEEHQEDSETELKMVYLENVCNNILNLILLPTQRCNFRCTYCYEGFLDASMTREVQERIIQYVGKNICKFNGVHISWFGGEPLLEIESIEYISKQIKKICRLNRKTFTANISTNGYLLTTDVFKRLMNCNIMEFHITIDGVKEIHDKQRVCAEGQKESFDVIINNLSDIKNTVKSKLFQIDIRSNISLAMIDKMAEYKEFLWKRFGGDDRFRLYIKPVMDFSGENTGKQQDLYLGEREIEIVYEALAEPDHKLYFSYGKFLEPGAGFCEAGCKNSYIITPKGRIAKCTCFFEQQKTTVGMLEAGGKFNTNRFLEGNWICDVESCQNKNCYFKPVCLGEPCPAVRVLKKQRDCPLEKKFLGHILRILDNNNDSFEKVGRGYDIG